VGAFGPQLKPYGRDFKLYGYTSSDGQKHLPPIALTLQTSFTHSAGDHDGALEGLEPNDNFLGYQQISAYYGGRVTKEVGAFVQVTYDQVGAVAHWDNLDLRYAHPLQIFGQDSVLGITLNNSPTVQDLWNSTPAWGFPYNTSPVAPTPSATSLADGTLAQQVLGVGGYVSWNDWLYAEGTVYRSISRYLAERLGVESSRTTEDLYGAYGAVPYGRVALEHGNDKHYFQAGAFTLEAERYPPGSQSAGAPDHIVDRAFDASYQFKGGDNHFVSAHAIYIHENEDLRADHLENGTLSKDELRTLRADVSYSFKDTLTPSFQLFKTTGSRDAALWGTPNGNPESRGYVAEIAYVPWGKMRSPIPWMNLRLAAQYVSYRVFDGSSRESSLNDTLFLSLWVAVAPLYAVEKSSLPK
jgi:hypothetical protein